MILAAQAKLKHRSDQLQNLMLKGNSVQIIAARESLRLSLVEMHELGYWRDYPEQFRKHMHLYRTSATMMFNPPVSMSGPDKRGQCTP